MGERKGQRWRSELREGAAAAIAGGAELAGVGGSIARDHDFSLHEHREQVMANLFPTLSQPGVNPRRVCHGRRP